MDKRKLKITKSNDGRTTVTRNKFGSGYKKESNLLRTSKEIDSLTSMDEASKSHNAGYDPIQLICDIEKRIFKFLINNNLPTEGTKKPVINALPFHLIENYSHVIGAYQAGECLKEIIYCKQSISNNNYRKATAHSLRLVDAFSKFIFSTLEPTLALGKSRQDKMIASNTKLTNEQYSQCFVYFESLDKTKDGNRKLSKTEKWDYTKKYALKEFNVDMTADRIRKKYNEQIV